MSHYPFNWGVRTLTLALACLSGCQVAQHATSAPEQVSATAGEKPGPRQVADLQIAFARTLEQRGDPGNALKNYLEALKHDPNRADACLRVATLLDQQGQFEKAQEFYSRAQAAQPSNPDLHCNLGYSLYLQHRWSEAESALRQALALDRDHKRAHNNLGLVLAQTGRSEEALAEFRKAGCGEAAAHSNLAFALTLEEHWPEARAQYEKALTADPSSASAKKRLQELTLLQVRVERAEQVRPDFREVRPVAGRIVFGEDEAPAEVAVAAAPALANPRPTTGPLQQREAPESAAANPGARTPSRFRWLPERAEPGRSTATAQASGGPEEWDSVPAAPPAPPRW